MRCGRDPSIVYMERTVSTSRLRRLDSAPFTLHQHCGHLLADLRQCLKGHNVTGDPVALEEAGWGDAKPCHTLWDEYRRCGRTFFAATHEAQTECAEQVAAYKRCAAAPGAECNAEEMALWRCTTSRIKLRMTSDLPKSVL